MLTMTPRPSSLFYLQPMNQRARESVDDPLNEHLRITIDGNIHVLDVGLHIHSKTADTLATLGRGDTDIFIKGSSISKVQCSFEINHDTGIIMLYDRSHGQTTQCLHESFYPFESGRPRRVVVQKGINKTIGMGGARKDLVIFELLWHQGTIETAAKVKHRHQDPELNPRLARTVEETETAPSSRYPTRIGTPAGKLPMRYWPVCCVGQGAFGLVQKAINIDTGDFIAVKQMKLDSMETFKREVKVHAALCHPHIIDFLGTQCPAGSPNIEIIMPLKDGTVQDLVQNKSTEENQQIAQVVLHHSLMALDYLSVKGLIHRDVKPENIFVSGTSPSWHFELGDFGCSNQLRLARTCAGTPLYWAPEMWLKREKCEQTSKMDIWSLGITILFILDMANIRKEEDKWPGSSLGEVPEPISPMVEWDPSSRASAAQMLQRWFGGAGLTTKGRIPPITPARGPISSQDIPVTVKEKQSIAKLEVGAATKRATRIGLPAPRRLRRNQPVFYGGNNRLMRPVNEKDRLDAGKSPRAA